jgi:hypothetical protein
MTGKEKTRSQRVALIQAHTIKSLNKKTRTNKLNDRNHHMPINTNTEYQQTQLPHQKTLFGRLD